MTDLVDRQQAIEALRKCGAGDGYVVELDSAVDVLQSLPVSPDAAPECPTNHGAVKNAETGEKYLTYAELFPGRYKFCPDCGDRLPNPEFGGRTGV